MTDDNKLVETVARAISIPQHHTTWDLLSEAEKSLFYMQAEWAIKASGITTLTARQSTLFDAIAHGDEDHRAWLKEAINAHFAGEVVPEPRGSGNKEARIARLTARLEEADQRAERARFEALEEAAQIADETAADVKTGLKNKLIDPAGMLACVANDIRALSSIRSEGG